MLAWCLYSRSIYLFCFRVTEIHKRDAAKKFLLVVLAIGYVV